jgi:hypothetical protein
VHGAQRRSSGLPRRGRRTGCAPAEAARLGRFASSAPPHAFTLGACVAIVAIHIAWAAKPTLRKPPLWEPNWPAALDLNTPEGLRRFFDTDGTT